MNVYKIVNNSKIYGPGSRDVIWFKGCTLGCKNCINKNLWKTSTDCEFEIKKIIPKLKSKHITLLGGEPLQQKDILIFIKQIKKLSFDIILFTGYEKQELSKMQLEAANLCDVVIYGRYDENLKDDSLYLRGSTNQRIEFNSDIYSEKDFNKPNQFEIFIGKEIESHGRSKNFVFDLFNI